MCRRSYPCPKTGHGGCTTRIIRESGVVDDFVQRSGRILVRGFKNELVHPIGAFATVHEAKVAVARYIRWHNTTRVIRR